MKHPWPGYESAADEREAYAYAAETSVTPILEVVLTELSEFMRRTLYVKQPEQMYRLTLRAEPI